MTSGNTVLTFWVLLFFFFRRLRLLYLLFDFPFSGSNFLDFSLTLRYSGCLLFPLLPTFISLEGAVGSYLSLLLNAAAAAVVFEAVVCGLLVVILVVDSVVNVVNAAVVLNAGGSSSCSSSKLGAGFGGL